MKISIENQSFSKNTIEVAEVRWKIHFQKTKKVLVILVAFSVLLLVMGITTGNKFSIINTGERKIYFNLNLFTSLGVSSILVLFYTIHQLYLSKKNFLNATREIERKFNDVHEIIYEFNDTEIIIDRKHQYERNKWNLFETKIYHDKFIFLNYSSKSIDGISIDGRLFSESDFIALKEQIDKKVSGFR